MKIIFRLHYYFHFPGTDFTSAPLIFLIVFIGFSFAHVLGIRFVGSVFLSLSVELMFLPLQSLPPCRTMKLFVVGSEWPPPGGVLGTQLLRPWVSWLRNYGCSLTLLQAHGWEPCPRPRMAQPQPPSPFSVCYMDMGILGFLPTMTFMFLFL